LLVLAIRFGMQHLFLFFIFLVTQQPTHEQKDYDSKDRLSEEQTNMQPHWYIPPQTLNSASLEQMLHKGPISKSRAQECKDLRLKASEEEVDCAFPIFWREYGLSHLLFSIY